MHVYHVYQNVRFCLTFLCIFPRWLKYEELVEDGDRWSKPHVGTASLHALLQIRKGLCEGSIVVCLDLVSMQGCGHQVAGQSAELSVSENYLSVKQFKLETGQHCSCIYSLSHFSSDISRLWDQEIKLQ